MKEKVASINWKCECEICGHVWQTKTEAIPTVCSKCSSRNWDKSSKGEIEKAAIIENPVGGGLSFGEMKTGSVAVEALEQEETEFVEEEREIVTDDIGI